jgi:hypothetical protein
MSNGSPSRLGLYKVLIARMDGAIAGRFYLESLWLAYAILEDRLVSVLNCTGGADDKNGDAIWKMDKKLQVLKERRKHDRLFQAYFPIDWTSRVAVWKNARNQLTHAMANGTITATDLDIQSEALAKTGSVLVYETCRQTRQLKRNRHQSSVPAHPYTC